MLDKRHIDQFVVTAENIADFGVVHNAFSAITHLNYFCLFGPYFALIIAAVDAILIIGPAKHAEVGTVGTAPGCS